MPYTGIPLALLATTAYNSGLILEKRALEQLPAIDVRRALSLARTVLTAPQWLAGFSLMLCGLAFQVIVLTIEPVTVVQPVLACGVVIVIVLSRLLLHEQLGGGEFGCVAVMAVSVILLALSTGGPTPGSGHNVNGCWMAATAVPSFLAGLIVARSALRATSRKHRPPVTGVSYGIGTGLLYGVAALAIKAMSGILAHGQATPRPRRRRRGDRNRRVTLPVRNGRLLGGRPACFSRQRCNDAARPSWCRCPASREACTSW